MYCLPTTFELVMLEFTNKKNEPLTKCLTQISKTWASLNFNDIPSSHSTKQTANCQAKIVMTLEIQLNASHVKYKIENTIELMHTRELHQLQAYNTLSYILTHKSQLSLWWLSLIYNTYTISHNLCGLLSTGGHNKITYNKNNVAPITFDSLKQ